VRHADDAATYEKLPFAYLDPSAADDAASIPTKSPNAQNQTPFLYSHTYLSSRCMWMIGSKRDLARDNVLESQTTAPH